MNSLKHISKVLFLFVVFAFSLYAQDISIQDMIGKSKDAVLNKYGKPVFMDDSNSEMLCMFYKTNGTDITFVSDNKGIFQAEARAAYTNEKSAKSVLDDFLKKALAEKYSIDTLEANAFTLQGTGVKVELQLLRNPITKKYNLNVKARRYGL